MMLVDYEKAFDSINRDILWKFMSFYEIPPKIVSMVQVMYTSCIRAVVGVAMEEQTGSR